MRHWINTCVVVVLFVFLASGAHAGMKLRVEKKAMTVSSPSSSGIVVVWGNPGSIYGAHPIQVSVYNKDLKLMRGGVVLPDGSFSVSVPGHGDDDIKITFSAANGKRKSVGLEVPEYAIAPPRVVVEPGTVTETVIYPGSVIEKKTITEDVEVVQ